MSERTWWEAIEAEGGHVIKNLEKMIAEGNVRRIKVTHNGRTVAEFPLTVGFVGVVLAPVLAAIGAMAAILTDCKIEVEKVENS